MAIKFPGPTFPKREIPTPFGKVSLPEVEPPEIKRPEIDERRRTALRHGIAADASMIFEGIPWVGGLISQTISDLHEVELKKQLSPGEYDRFLEANKKTPGDSLSLLYLFMKEPFARR